MGDDGYRDDLLDFVRYGRLDGYDLTDEELAAMLEVWRWSVWRKRNQPTAPDFDVLEASRKIQRQLAAKYNIEVEYNTTLLMKQEIEPLMYLRVLLDVPKAIAYFVRPSRWLPLVRAFRQARRYKRVEAMIDPRSKQTCYPKFFLETFRIKAPNLLKRPYWRQLSPYTFDQRKQMDYWW